MKAKHVFVLLLLTSICWSCASTKNTRPPIAESEPSSSSRQHVSQMTASELSQDLRQAQIAGGQPILAQPSIRKPARMKTGLLGAPFQQLPEMAVPADEEKQKVILNYDKADVAQVTSQIFGDYLKLNYVIDPALQGRISLYLEGEFSKKELLQLVIKAYKASNISIVPRKGIYYIQSIQRSTSSGLPIATPFMLQRDGDVSSPTIVIYRLRYIDAKQAVSTIKLFLTPGRPITTDQLTNSIIFAEEPANARTILELLRSLDINILQEVGMEIVPLQSLTPDEAVKGLESLMSKLDIFKQGGLKSEVAFIPLQRFGGVLILAQNPEILNSAKRWLLALDIQGQETGEQIYVYFMKNALAKDVGDILNQVFKTGGGKPEEPRPQQKIVSATETPSAAEQAKTSITGGVAIGTTLTGEVVIITDEVNNALVVRANAADYAMISKVIEALDIVPRAVLIEVMLAEISLDKELQYGVEWYLKENKVTQRLNTGVTGNLEEINLLTTPFSGYTLFYDAGDIVSLINLLADKTNVNILSTPTLLASDNQEASITVGGRTPISTGETVTDGGTTVTSISYEETGIILTVTPHINAGGMVRLEVDQTIRTVSPDKTSGIDSPTFDERKVKTSVLAQDNQTVVIGGIIQHQKSHTKSGIPFLMDVPLLSPIFSSTSDQYKRTELIIAITPHVISRRDQEIATTKEFLKRLQSLRRRIESQAH